MLMYHLRVTFTLIALSFAAIGCGDRGAAVNSAGGDGKPQVSSDEIIRLQGRWEYTSEDGKSSYWLIKGDKLFNEDSNNKSELRFIGTISLNTQTAPHQFDIDGKTSDGKPEQTQGVFQLEGDVLRVAMGGGGQDSKRPQSLTKENTFILIKTY